MRRIALCTCLLLLFTVGKGYAAGDVGAAFGTLTTARSIGAGHATLIGGAGIAQSLSAVAMFRYGFSDQVDGRFKIGLRDEGATDAELTVGADIKYQVWSADPGEPEPVDLAFGGMAELWDSILGDLWHIGAYVLGSKEYAFDHETAISPYGRAHMRVERIAARQLSGDSTELELGLSLGAMVQVGQTFLAYGELQYDGNNGLFIGVEFPMNFVLWN